MADLELWHCVHNAVASRIGGDRKYRRVDWHLIATPDGRTFSAHGSCLDFIAFRNRSVTRRMSGRRRGRLISSRGYAGGGNYDRVACVDFAGWVTNVTIAAHYHGLYTV